jgi:long-subunit fatty acid transport protein
MKVTKKIFGILSLVGLLGSTLQAQLAEDALRYSQLGLGVGARELGMGDATVGGVNDYSALFWNPAGLALERDYEFSIGLSRSGYSNDASYFGTTTTADKNAINLNNIGIVYPVPTARGSLTFAFGFNRAANYSATASMNGYNPTSSVTYSDAFPAFLWLYDTTTNAPIVNHGVQQIVNVLESGGLNHWTVGGAMDIGPNISLGVSLNFSSGSYSYDRTFEENDSKNLYTVYPNDFNQLTYESTYNDDISGFNALFGLMYRKPGVFSLGVSVRTATKYDISETYGDIAQSSFKNGDSFVYPSSYPTPTSQSLTYHVTTPYVLSGGISVQPLDWLLLAGDAEYTDWTQMELSSDNIDFSSENHVIKTEMQATTNLRAGVEISILKYGLKLRGGIIDNPSPYKGDPSSYDKLYYTTGFGLLLDERTTLNAGFAYGTWKQPRINYSYGATPVNVTSSESVTTTMLNLTVSYRF